ncbi:MAG: acyl-CoA ligase (AMP-forming), exosortase A system-associated, partial [Alphaproteobacteria bacterium]
MIATLGALVTTAAAHHGDSPAVTERRGAWSFIAVAQAATCFAGGLAALDLPRGSRVAIYLPKRRETVAAMLGAAMAGHVFVPVNPLLKAMQVAHILADSGAALLVTSADRAAILDAHWAALPDLAHLLLVDGAEQAAQSPQGQQGPRSHGWDAFMAAPSVPAAAVGSGDLAAILYTSGSTGRPKGVMLSHSNLLLGADAVTQYLGNGPADCILALLPFSFDYGLNQLLSGLYAGAHVVLHDYLLAGDVVRAVARHRITGLAGVPPLWHQLTAANWPEPAAASLRYITNSGGHMPRPLLKRLRSLFPQAQVFLMYGLTEAFRSTYLDPALVDVRPDSIGKAVPHAEVMAVRPDGSLCDADEPGELVHAGPLVAQGYWRDPAGTARRFRAAPKAARHRGLAVWSGDTVRRDAAGFFYFVGRDDEMIKTLGQRVSPT